ncbi:2a protein [Spring beauty latent virus]|uniref:RNA-directed RNA polymerase 2a n=1 Tax=Spring beauty latent virus TaxID=188141 RepID=Q8JW07_9BROM|nr:2a protein [Spring beauty latent virus]BAC10646.1 2a protein [Spring beauty latent virus]
MSKPYVPDFEYQIPSFQWLIDDSLKREPEVALDVETGMDVNKVYLPESGFVADGSLASYILAVQPVVKGEGSFEPPFDQARWGVCCEHAASAAEIFTDRHLLPTAEIARMLYLDIPGSFIDESEEDDWVVEDTTDGYGEYRHSDEDAIQSPLFSAELTQEIAEEKPSLSMDLTDENHDERQLSSGPSELTLGDRYVVTNEEFKILDSDYGVTLNLLNPVENRVGLVEDTLPTLDSDSFKEGPKYLERVSLPRLEAAGHTILPTHAYFDDSFYQAIEENSDMSLDFNRINLKQSDVDWYRDPDKYFEPHLNIGSFQRRVGTQKTVLTALKKRNADVPEMGDVVDIKSVAADVARTFLKTFLNKDGKDCLLASMDVLAKGLDYHNKWKTHRDLQGVTLCTEQNLQRYQHMIKTDIKPVVTDTLHIERAIAATITFHGKGVTSCFSPFFTACFEKFSLALKKRFIVPIGKISSLELKNIGLNNKWFLEADLSKFDKSQGELHLEFQREILLSLGFPAPLTNWWSDFHRSSYLSDPHAKVSMPVSFQRRTGDAFTYFGNTLVTMAMIAYTVDLSEATAIFSGDDSLIISDKKLELDTEVFSSLFNMEIKVMDPSVPYICSKFLVETENGNLVSIPDPLRELQRMAKRKILKDKEMLKAHFTSFCDRMKFIEHINEKSIEMLCKFVSLKYKKSIDYDVRVALAAFSYYSENFLRFSECYVTEGSNVFLKKDPIRNVLGEEEPDYHDKDSSWFRDWRNTSFKPSRLLNKLGLYSVEDPLKNVKSDRRVMEKCMNTSLKLAYDNRSLQRMRLKLDYLKDGIGDINSVEVLKNTFVGRT